MHVTLVIGKSSEFKTNLSRRNSSFSGMGSAGCQPVGRGSLPRLFPVGLSTLKMLFPAGCRKLRAGSPRSPESTSVSAAHEFGEDAVFRDEVVERALFGDAALIEDKDTIGLI